MNNWTDSQVQFSLVMWCPFSFPSWEISPQAPRASSNRCRESERMHALCTTQHVLAALLTSESKLIENAAMLVRIKCCTFLKTCLHFSRAIWRRVVARAWKCSLAVQPHLKRADSTSPHINLRHFSMCVCTVSVCACVWRVLPCTFTRGLSARLTGWTCYSELVQERFSTRTFALRVLVVTSLRSTS